MTLSTDTKLTREQGEALRGTWVLDEVKPGHKRYTMDVGDGLTAIKNEYTVNEDLIQLNHESMTESQTQRFGDGKVVARIPENVFFSELAPRATDKDFQKWWLNREENAAYRSFRGKV